MAVMVTGVRVGKPNADGTESIVKKAIVHSAIAAEIILLCCIVSILLVVFFIVRGAFSFQLNLEIVLGGVAAKVQPHGPLQPGRRYVETSGDVIEDNFRSTSDSCLLYLSSIRLGAAKMAHYGRIINISSSAGRMVSTLGGAHYTASKAGLLGLTRAAAKELGKFGITVNAICPGIIDTELTREHASDQLLERLAASYPVPRLGTALEVADLICFAASEAAGYITGASLDINGGDLMM
jgi:NAD(P)-dependent dehydrogenase (short-subunit alcohol dehydrogenase family)